ncbi:MliC family protein [Brevundimonas sp. 2R-24]|uniref:MliC family protein n=1 Tax=Peiella sedimenti TaxID=3061083 RepID=A0ABT8SLJ9_9CAUL|nr:MliC family protein [Caulobacteraceae bacterium XZ-24]
MRHVLLAFLMLGLVGLMIAACSREAPPTAREVEARALAVKRDSRTGAERQEAAVTRLIRTQYVCVDGQALNVTFDNAREMATIRKSDGTAVDLRQERAADGIWYRSDTHELRGRGDTAVWTRPAAEPVNCRAVA